MLSSEGARAGFFKNCFEPLRAWKQKSNHIQVSKERLAAWKSALDPEQGGLVDLPYFSSGREESMLDFWASFFLLPTDLIDWLKTKISADTKQNAQTFESLRDELGITASQLSFLYSIELVWRKTSTRTHEVVGFVQWIESGRQFLHENAGKVEDARVRVRHQRDLLLARKEWFASTQLSLEFKEVDGKLKLFIGDQSYFAKLKGNEVELTVSRSKIKIPAWNPLDLNYVMKLAQGSEKVSFYPCVVGLDGNFYNTDKNHRFAIETRDEVKVRIALPAQTVNVPVFLDLVGIREKPSDEQVLQLIRNEVSLKDILSVSAIESMILLH